MHSARLVAAVLPTLFAIGCISLPDIEPTNPPSDQADGGAPDGSTANPTDGGSPDGGEPIPTSIVIESPSNPVFTKDLVNVQIKLTGLQTASIELLANGSVISTLSSPFSYTWDTQAMPEGSYSLQARLSGSSPPVVSEARTIIIDRTSPQFTLRQPAPGSANVSVKATIQAEFSEALESTTIKDTTVTLSAGGTNISKSLSLSTDGKTLTITPTATLSSPTQMSVVFSAEVTDLARNSLAPPSTAWSWSLPEWLFLTDGLGVPPAYRPSLALDPAGLPAVSWEDDNNIYAQRLESTNWVGLGGALSANPGNTPSSSSSLQFKASGDPVIAWTESDGISENIYVREWVTDKWQAIGPALSAYPGSTNAGFPSLGLKADGSPVVAWSESDGSVQNVHVRQWTNGAWQAIGSPLSAVAGNTDAKFPTLVLDSSGAPVVAWQESDGTAINLYVSRWAGAAWQPLEGALSAYSGATDVTNSAIAIDQSDNPTVAWTEANSNGYFVHVRKWTGSSWQQVGNPMTSDLSPYYTDGISLKLTAQGQPFVAWVDYASTDQLVRLHLWRFVLGAWQHMVTLGNGAPSSPSLALDSAGTPFLAWSDNNTFGRGIFVVRQNR